MIRFPEKRRKGRKFSLSNKLAWLSRFQESGDGGAIIIRNRFSISLEPVPRPSRGIHHTIITVSPSGQDPGHDTGKRANRPAVSLITVSEYLQIKPVPGSRNKCPRKKIKRILSSSLVHRGGRARGKR